MEMIKGKPSEVVGKARHQQKIAFNPENDTFLDSTIDYVKDIDKSEWIWIDTFIFTDAHVNNLLATVDCQPLCAGATPTQQTSWLAAP